MVVLVAGHTQLNNGEPVYYGTENEIYAETLIEAVDIYRYSGLQRLREMFGDPGIIDSQRQGRAYGCRDINTGDYSTYYVNVDKDVIKTMVDSRYFMPNKN
jgi:hypothetical protein